uniref:Uncharacterized protein n=1 Tax=Chromera velia CCMP2878 TaxID=1169474 RepID=A0A0G4GH43_9ALVE|mmetsp:Transcript_17598/g.35715  ORF Transcript_17598/g.35715 Transcript_17598/m.35715 type:complete len:209 (-) Transcript_17598:66-692(-)|eukprot:Cvel_21819.t1-p1 / transcript=Cvel_21819.t1 / gene=Cvel_21819 / organism=Chromera_velia_CCMP2878 / gene_product=ADP-ribosylation factor-related protein 1, putative / transcript_product=ADP-ribosylation factor-related protein 1, putative / location=Cvel_scaffold2081:5152-5775(+) / protein_length=208 / sequence_SO=supercontig / SO=protein_coding / is_pseudo=false
MFGLLYGLWKWLFEKDKVNVLIIGPDNAGKTTVLEQLKSVFGKPSLHPEKIVPTIGFNLAQLEVDSIEAVFWDVGGGETVRPIWDNYFVDADGLVFVLDSADSSRLDEVRDLVRTHVFENPKLSECAPILVFSNKQDLEGCLSEADLSRKLDLQAFRDSRGPRLALRVQDCSALKKQGLEEGIRWLITAAKASKQHSHHHTAGGRRRT